MMAEISKGNTALPTRRFPVLLVDVAARFEAFTSDESLTRAPDYPTMTVDEIKALRIGDLATDPAIMFWWTSSAHLEQSFAIINDCRFRYSTCAVWEKTECAPRQRIFLPPAARDLAGLFAR
jgi:N6-adenosine-specific RNA methylase IME4